MGATGVGTSAWRKDQKGPQAILDAAEVSTPSSIDPTLTRISILRVFIFYSCTQFFIFYASVGREQLHSLLERLRPSIRQMSYPTFMKMHKFFFVVRNMKAKGIIQ